jgi:hypothetical protein
MDIVLGVLSLLYMFSKRSNFISRLSCTKKATLLNRLKYLAEVSSITTIYKKKIVLINDLSNFTFLELGWQRMWFWTGRLLP